MYDRKCPRGTVFNPQYQICSHDRIAVVKLDEHKDSNTVYRQRPQTKPYGADNHHNNHVDSRHYVQQPGAAINGQGQGHGDLYRWKGRSRGGVVHIAYGYNHGGSHSPDKFRQNYKFLIKKDTIKTSTVTDGPTSTVTTSTSETTTTTPRTTTTEGPTSTMSSTSVTTPQTTSTTLSSTTTTPTMTTPTTTTPGTTTTTPTTTTVTDPMTSVRTSMGSTTTTTAATPTTATTRIPTTVTTGRPSTTPGSKVKKEKIIYHYYHLPVALPNYFNPRRPYLYPHQSLLSAYSHHHGHVLNDKAGRPHPSQARLHKPPSRVAQELYRLSRKNQISSGKYNAGRRFYR